MTLSISRAARCAALVTLLCVSVATLFELASQVVRVIVTGKNDRRDR